MMEDLMQFSIFMEFIIFDFNDIEYIVSIIYDWLYVFLTKYRYQYIYIYIPFDNRNHDRSSVVLQKSLYK